MSEENKPKKLLFAETSVSQNAQNYLTRPAKYSAEQILTYLEDPQRYALELQRASIWLYYNSGIYNRLVNNYAGMNIYDLYLYPTTISKFSKSKRKITPEKLYKDYVDIASLMERISWKSNYRNIGVNLMIQGEVFLYDVSDNQGTIIKEIPTDICKICKVINDNLYKYAINIAKLGTEQYYLQMPKGLQDLYDKHKAGSLKPEQYFGNSTNWVIVDDPEAVCLSLNNVTSTKTVPPLSYLFPSLIRLMDEESNEITENKANNLKLIHMKYDVDDEGESYIDESDLIKMHNSAKMNLPTGVAITTNPLQVTAHTLQRTGNVSASNRQTLTELVYNNSGVNSEIFNGNQSNNQAVLTGVVADEIYCDTLNNLFENYTKYRIRQLKKNPLWMVRFVRNTQYNKNEVIDKAMQGCTVGLSRMKFLACNHYSPLEAISILEFETENGIDELFIPLATAYTQSGEEAQQGEKGEVGEGRPKNADNKDTSKGVGDNPNSTK